MNKKPDKRESKLETPHIKKEVIRQLAAGETQAAIAGQTGLTQPAVSRFANKEEIKALIEKEQRRLSACVPDAINNFMEVVREMPEIPKEDVRRRELSLGASKDVLKSFGLMPTPVQSQTLVNIYQDNRTQILSPVVMELLSRSVGQDSFIEAHDITEDKVDIVD